MLPLIAMIGGGCISTIQKKNNSLESVSIVTADIAVAQSKALIKSNIPAAIKYNQQIALINGKPDDIKSTNFDVAVSQVANNKYVIDRDIEIQLDQTQKELKSYKQYWGLHGVYLGIKQFIRNTLYSLTALSLVYLLLRIFANSNPVILATWNVISKVIAWFINQLALLCPKLLDNIKSTETEVVGEYKNIFNKIKSLFIKSVDNTPKV